MKQLPVAVLLILCISMSRGEQSELTGGCIWRGYEPAGPEILKLEQIESPVARLENNAIGGMKTFFATGSAGSNFAMHASKLLDMAPKLAPCLGILGVALGGAASLTSTKPQAVLDAANRAINTLANEIERKMSQMRDVIDQAVLNSEHLDYQLEFRTLAAMLSECINPTQLLTTKDAVNQCMVDALSQANIKIDTFLLYKDNLKQWLRNDQQTPSRMEVRRMESRMVLFRSYARHVLMLIKTLKETYCEVPTTSEDTEKKQKREYACNVFKAESSKMLEKFENYTRDAVAVIVKVHKSGTCNTSNPEQFRCGRYSLKDSYCDRLDILCIPSVARQECWCKFDSYTNRPPCNFKKVHSFYSSRGDYTEADMNKDLNKFFQEYLDYYLAQGEGFIERYWEVEVSDMMNELRGMMDATSEEQAARRSKAQNGNEKSVQISDDEINKYLKPTQNSKTVFKNIYERYKELAEKAAEKEVEREKKRKAKEKQAEEFLTGGGAKNKKNKKKEN